MAPWWQFPITQAHGENGEQGVDFGVPFHTPLTPILPGTVQRVDCSAGWRCEVDILTQYQGRSAVESFLHIDQPMVQVGQQVGTGTVVGLSGGQLSGGANPDSPQFSTGPHTEFDIFMGTQPWQNAIDPTALARGGPQAGGTGGLGSVGSAICSDPALAGLVGIVGCEQAQNIIGAVQGAQNAAGGLGNLAQALDPARALGSLGSAFTGNSSVQDFSMRALLIIGGLILFGLGIYALIHEEGGQELSGPVGRTAMKTAGEAAAV